MRAHFNDSDNLKFSDMGSNYKHLGSFDETNGSLGQTTSETSLHFDKENWQNLAWSKFTLCPGGDNAWSLRFFEAIMAGSIPVIHNVEQDFGCTSKEEKSIGYKFYTVQDTDDISGLKHRADWVEHNQKLFLR